MHSARTDQEELCNEKLLFLFNARHGLAPYSHAFVETMMDAQILSGFISAMLSFMQEAWGSRQSHWKTEYGSDSTLIVEVGDWIVGVLAVSRVTAELRSKVRRIVREFEDSFQFLRDADSITGGVFDEFDGLVRREFVSERLSGRSILTKRGDWVLRTHGTKGQSVSEDVASLLTAAKDGSTIAEIASAMNMSTTQVVEGASRAVWQGLAGFIYLPSDKDILSLSEGSSSVILARNNPLGLSAETIMLLSRLDGRTDIVALLQDVTPKKRDVVLTEVGSLLNRGYVQRESIERIALLMSECIVSLLLRSSAKLIGFTAARSYLTKAISRGSSAHPWIGRVTADGDLRVRSRLDDTMSPTDTDDIRAALAFAQQDITEQIMKNLGQEKGEEIVLDAQQTCYRIWSELIDGSS